MSLFIDFTSATGKNYIFSHITAISGFECVDATVLSVQNATMDGAIFTGAYLNTRELTIAFDITDATPEEYENRKLAMLSVLTTAGREEGMMRCVKPSASASIRCKPIDITETRQGKKMGSFMARFQCCDPYFKDTQEKTQQLKFVKKRLVFPVTFPTVFGEFINRGLIFNTGHGACPVLLRFKGGTVEPKFTNLTTGQSIGITGTVPEGYVLEINTERTKKTVELIDGDGNRTNAFAMLDLSSEFWTLVQGENEIEYSSAGNAAESTAELAYSLRYIGV